MDSSLARQKQKMKSADTFQRYEHEYLDVNRKAPTNAGEEKVCAEHAKEQRKLLALKTKFEKKREKSLQVPPRSNTKQWR